MQNCTEFPAVIYLKAYLFIQMSKFLLCPCKIKKDVSFQLNIGY